MKPLKFERLVVPAEKSPPLNGQPFGPGQSSDQGVSVKQLIIFWGVNALFVPLVALVYIVVVAEGLRMQMSVFAMRLYKLPVPGAGLLRQYDGFDRLDLAVPMSLMLFIAVSYLWIRFWKEVGPHGGIMAKRDAFPVYFWMQVAVACIIVLFDAGIFYLGLIAKASSSWSGTSTVVPLAATILYAAGLAMLGAWHADHHDKRRLSGGYAQ